MTQRYEHRPAGKKWAIFDHKVGKAIATVHSGATAEHVVIELNKMEERRA